MAGRRARLEWAYDLLRNYGKSRRTTRLVNDTRNIVIPIVNPDGFNISREAPDFPAETEFDTQSYEMKRKNCWPDPANPGPCNDNPTAGAYHGVDPNRNYGGFWGGPGAERSPPARRSAAPGRSPSRRARTSARCSRSARSPT